ncbi:hypothetical protein PCASD_19638 [Puccinia coronata f. sp. avenae]|uniref:Uncharacterized protein n=1 Tax=Puccinia coronata f. sp. avenae TaxID=200324 RepID=A0A2N5S7W8_9BASI|nr:hypothetical protein PCASD_19638 [Puccinia coronata f. sp. avenae]
MNFAKIWDFTLPTSVGGFLGPEITSPHGLLFDYPARGDPSPHEDMQICIQFLWLLAPLGLGMLRRSEVPVKMGHSAECPTNSSTTTCAGAAERLLAHTTTMYGKDYCKDHPGGASGSSQT